MPPPFRSRSRFGWRRSSKPEATSAVLLVVSPSHPAGRAQRLSQPEGLSSKDMHKANVLLTPVPSNGCQLSRAKGRGRRELPPESRRGKPGLFGTRSKTAALFKTEPAND